MASHVIASSGVSASGSLTRASRGNAAIAAVSGKPACSSARAGSLTFSSSGFAKGSTVFPKHTAAINMSRSSVKVYAGVPEVNEETFEAEVLKADGPVLVDFWATWCGPCKLVAPIMDWAQTEYGDNIKVVKCETDPSPALVETYKVYGLPTLILFKDGVEVEGSKREGAINKAKLATWLEENGVSK